MPRRQKTLLSSPAKTRYSMTYESYTSLRNCSYGSLKSKIHCIGLDGVILFVYGSLSMVIRDLFLINVLVSRSCTFLLIAAHFSVFVFYRDVDYDSMSKLGEK
jgi:hypothetical protein